MCVTIAVPLLNFDDGKVLSNIMQQSECTIKISLVLHQSATTPPPCRPDPPGITIFFCLGWQIPGGGDEKRGQMPHPPSTLQHFSLIAQSNSAAGID